MPTDLENAMQHHYTMTPGGVFVPGVTTCIQVMDKPQLVWAASKIAAQSLVWNWDDRERIISSHRRFLADKKGKPEWVKKHHELSAFGSDDDILIDWARGEHQRVWNTKMHTGTEVHTIGEAWANGEDIQIEPRLLGYVGALRAFWEVWQPNYLLIEEIVVHKELMFGGRFDFIAGLSGPGSEGVFLCDYKTGGKYEIQVALQSIAYMMCQRVTFNEDGSLGDLLDLPKLDGARTIYLDKNGEVTVYDPFEKISMEQAWEAFKSCRSLYGALQTIEKVLR